MDFTPFDRRGYPVVSVVTGYAEWVKTYDETVTTGLDEPLLDSLTSINWPHFRLAAGLPINFRDAIRISKLLEDPHPIQWPPDKRGG